MDAGFQTFSDPVSFLPAELFDALFQFLFKGKKTLIRFQIQRSGFFIIAVLFLQ